MNDPSSSLGQVRRAKVLDIPALMHIRNGVRENALVSQRIEHADYVKAMDQGPAWLFEREGEVLGFVHPRHTPRDVWALFVLEGSHGQGIGRALMERAEAWLFENSKEPVRLSTAPGTRAEAFYTRRGWQVVGGQGSAELVLELSHAAWLAAGDQT